MTSPNSTENADILSAIKEHFGFDEFRPGQADVISNLLDGRSSLAVFPTGSGKSLCYQLPALLLDGLTVVISPLVALMKDQVDALRAKGVAAARLDSSLEASEFQEITSNLRERRLRILYVAPERLANPAFQSLLAKQNISLLAVDEAHCISEWGHNFRPDYLKIAKLADRLGINLRLALTATATPEVSRDICEGFGVDPDNHVQTGFRRPNLSLNVTPVERSEKIPLLAQRLNEHPGPAIVYVTHQRTAEEVAGELKRTGIPSRAYHAGMRAEDRAEVQDGFMDSSIETVVATIAFGMGIDKSDIRSVFHYNLPKSLENYVQETGRAGRDGKPAHCELLACQDDRVALENFVFGDTPTSSSIKSMVERILLQGDTIEFSQYHLSRSLDIRPLVIETVLTYLELDGFIQPEGTSYSTYKVRPVRTIDQIAAGHTPDRAQFIRRLFEAGKQGRSLITLNIPEAAAEIGEPVERIRRALRWLEESGDVGLQPSGLIHKYTRLVQRGDFSLSKVIEDLQRRFEDRENREVSRIDSILAFASTGVCLTNHVLSHFGENSKSPCGQCTSCIEDSGGREIPGGDEQELTAEDMEVVRELIDEHHPSLRSPRQLARFLCGINSPAASAARLGRHDTFGHFSERPFLDVLAVAETMIL